jgi:ATP-binding cassette subfamily C exporter for protease/lipase
MAIFFAGIQALLAWLGNLAVKPAQASASKVQAEVGGYLQSKFRNAEVLESMGMVGNLYRRWSGKNSEAMKQTLHAQNVVGNVMAWSKFVRYTHDTCLGAYRFDGGNMGRISECARGIYQASRFV